MIYRPRLRKGSLILFLTVLFSSHCSRYQQDETAASSDFGEEATEAPFEPADEPPGPEAVPGGRMVHSVGKEFRNQTGLVRKPGDFWIGFPGEPGATPYLRMDEGVEVAVLSLVDDYYKVRYLNLTGFVKKSMVELIKPEPAVSAAAGGATPGETTAGAAETATKEQSSSSPSVTPCTGLGNEDIFPGVSCDTYRAKVQEKVNTLENYITRILDKTEPNRQKAIDQACRLFVNEHAQVYTSGVNEPARSRPIRKYLNSLMALSYDKVTIEWTNIQYLSELRKGPDGRYFGFVHIEQKFQGFTDGRLVYGDVTEKKITVILEAYEIINAQGESDTRWDIFLSDIGVEQTQSI